MSTQSTPSGKKSSLNDLNRKAGLYSLAAAAAGVSILALAQPANGEVVITKKMIPIPANQGQYGVGIDLNHDGVNDFYFDFRSATLQPNFRTLNITAVQGELIGFSSYEPNNVYASALRRGAKIGPSAPFSFVPNVVVERSYPKGASSEKLMGEWGGDPKNRYLGVRFLIKGEYHYGWIRLTVHTLPMSATITAYAYETVPNQAILAGTAEIETAEVQGSKANQTQAGPSLGMLAAGAEGLPLWRREESSAGQ